MYLGRMEASKNIGKMGLIKEPEGVDFIIQSPPLTDQERKEISEFIQSRKMENKRTIKRTNLKKKSKIDV
jgi:hypothetical protein